MTKKYNKVLIEEFKKIAKNGEDKTIDIMRFMDSICRELQSKECDIEQIAKDRNIPAELIEMLAQECDEQNKENAAESGTQTYNKSNEVVKKKIVIASNNKLLSIILLVIIMVVLSPILIPLLISISALLFTLIAIIIPFMIPILIVILFVVPLMILWDDIKSDNTNTEND